MKITLIRVSFLVLLLGALGLFALPALAAPPNNDTFPNATLVTLGFSERLDTTEATTDADDVQLNASCGEQATDASVWYALEGTGTEVVVEAIALDYYATLLVGTGTQGNLTLVTCGLEAVSFYAEAGTTYYILAVDNQGDGGGNGGILRISFSSEFPPPPTLEFSVDPYGTFNPKMGTATISGQYTCTDGYFFHVVPEVRQRVGQAYVWVWGEFYDVEFCDGETHPWSAEIIPENGVFKGGKVLTVTFGITCNIVDCAYGNTEQEVKLRGR